MTTGSKRESSRKKLRLWKQNWMKLCFFMMPREGQMKKTDLKNMRMKRIKLMCHCTCENGKSDWRWPLIYPSTGTLARLNSSETAAHQNNYLTFSSGYFGHLLHSTVSLCLVQDAFAVCRKPWGWLHAVPAVYVRHPFTFLSLSLLDYWLVTVTSFQTSRSWN